jgi:hypothetical protein
VALQRTTDVVRAFVRQHFGIAFEILDAWYAQDQARCFELDIRSCHDRPPRCLRLFSPLRFRATAF